MNSKTKNLIKSVAFEAGEILKKLFSKTHRVEKKRGAGIVTEADKKAENFIVKKLLKFFPNSSIITEERGTIGSVSSIRWIIDPLDGTSNYAHGFPWFSVSIALYEENEPLMGVIYNPIFKEMFFAERNNGTYLNNKKVVVSKTKNLSDALLGTGFYYTKGEKLKYEIELFRRLNEKCLAVRRPGSAALDLAYVSCGRYDGFWERGLSCWDVAAGVLMVKEANGKVTDYKGNDTTIFNKEFLASNGYIHKEISKILSYS